MLDKEKCEALQTQTDQFLGKPPPVLHPDARLPPTVSHSSAQCDNMTVPTVGVEDNSGSGRQHSGRRVHWSSDVLEGQHYSNCGMDTGSGAGFGSSLCPVMTRVDEGSASHPVAASAPADGSGVGPMGGALGPLVAQAISWMMIASTSHSGSGIGPAQHGPGRASGKELHTTLQSILSWTAPAMMRPEFSFRWTVLAAKKNLEILLGYSMNLAKALQAQPVSALLVGSEFRPAVVLKPLCHLHPLWP